jgi:hypothetical protein
VSLTLLKLAYQGVSPYGWQVVGNMLAVTSGLIAATLYGNIGIKVLYNNVFMEFFNSPSLLTKKGKILWACIVPFYWIIAFILAASIPDFFGLTNMTAAICFVVYVFVPSNHRLRIPHSTKCHATWRGL